MSTDLQKTVPPGAVEVRKPLIAIMADRYGIEANTFLETIKKTIFPDKGTSATNEQVAAFLVVAHEHNLNPFTKEIYAFPTKGGGIMPIVGVDGWIKLVNVHPAYDGAESTDLHDAAGNLLGVQTTMWRKDRSHPTVITEWLKECKRDTDPWKQMPHRMIRHKSFMQCARYAFGFAGIMDEEEAIDAVTYAESGPIGGSVATKTEALKKQITAKTVQTPKEVTPSKVIDIAATEVPPEKEKVPNPSNPFKGDDLGGTLEPNKPLAPEDRLINDDERGRLVESIKAKAIPVPDIKEKILKPHGYLVTKEVKLKDLAAIQAAVENYGKPAEEI
jgi:phage recombination protein Bet